MTKPRLTYFDAPISRGEECRLALHLAGVDFEDVRIKRSDWAALKPTTPFGSMPVLEMPGQRPLGQANAILTFIGRLNDLHPKDAAEAAQHEAIMCHVEDLRAMLAPTMRLEDPDERKRVREDLAATYLPTWARDTEKHLGAGPFLAGAKLHVADLKLYMVVRWLSAGTLDHIPSTIFDDFPKLVRLHDAVRDDARVHAWNAATH
jgi:glutathione S-transferase